MIVQFKSTAAHPLKASLVGQVGEVVAHETRDGVACISVRFPGVEVSGLPADLFEPAPEEGE